MNRTVTNVSWRVGATLAAALLAGCGGSEAPVPLGRADVPLRASVDVAPFAIEEIALSTTWPGDRIEAAGATARIHRPDGTSDAMSLNASADGRRLTLGQATVVPSDSADSAWQGTVSADVPLAARVDAPAGGGLTVTLLTREAGDTLGIAGASAYLYSPGSGTSPVDLAINAEQTEVILGPCQPGTDSQGWTNVLHIEGPLVVRDGATGTATEIGFFCLEFDVRSDGHVCLPSMIRASIPTTGTADDRRIVIEGLTPGHDQAWVGVGEQSGAWLVSKRYEADASGQIIITDTMARVTAERLSGPDSALWLVFQDPDAPTPPPSPPDGGGPPGPPVPAPGGGEADDGGSPLDVAVIIGPVWLVNGKTGARTQIGRIKFGFEVLADGTVVAPETLSLRIPASGTARDPSIGVTGLAEGDFVRVRIVEDSGTATVSPTYRAGSSGAATIYGALRGITGLRFSGPHSSLAFFFARTDTDDDGVPDFL